MYICYRKEHPHLARICLSTYCSYCIAIALSLSLRAWSVHCVIGHTSALGGCPPLQTIHHLAHYLHTPSTASNCVIALTQPAPLASTNLHAGRHRQRLAEYQDTFQPRRVSLPPALSYAILQLILRLQCNAPRSHVRGEQRTSHGDMLPSTCRAVVHGAAAY